MRIVDISWNIIWKCAFLVIAGIILLRISGRKSISQTTVATTVIMISVGEMIAHGIIENTIWRSVVVMGLFILTLMILEWVEVKSEIIQKWLSGEAITVIKDGNIDVSQLKKLRMTYKQLEMRLREKGISHVSDVQTATIEINGELGYELKRQAQPFTNGEMEKLLSEWKLVPKYSYKTDSPNLFVEPDQTHYIDNLLNQ
jgi:uncharacterized membrane protein YcaP (DUF421 family)